MVYNPGFLAYSLSSHDKSLPQLPTNKLKSSRLWTHGPDWLLNKSDWPTWTPTSVLHLQAEEDDLPAVPHTPEPTKSESGILSIVNISTFLAMVEDLQRLFKLESLQTVLECQNVTWHFIPKCAPWYDGSWERMVGITKQAIKKTLGRAFVTLKQLETIVVEIKAMLNDRPLTYISPDLFDPEPTHTITVIVWKENMPSTSPSR